MTTGHAVAGPRNSSVNFIKIDQTVNYGVRIAIDNNISGRGGCVDSHIGELQQVVMRSTAASGSKG